MHHVFCHVAAGKFPEQAPVDELIRIEFAIRPAVQECFPIDVLGGAVGGHLADPLTFAMRCIAAHPGFDRCDFADLPVTDPLSSVGQRARTLML